MKIIKKLSFQKILFIIVICLFVIGLITGDISFNLKKDNSSQKIIVWNLDNLVNVTWNLYISPDTSWLNFYDNISKVKKKLKIETYDFTKKELQSKFEELLNNWVGIKLIMENHKYRQFKNTRKDIENYFSGYKNFEIKSDEQMWTEYVHSKVNLVDSGFWIQTANLTNSSFAKNREHFFYSENTGVRKSLDTIFEKDRNWDKIDLDDIHSNLLVCNINCRGVIEKVLSDAKKSIWIQTQYIVDDRILDILKNKINTDSYFSLKEWRVEAKRKLDIKFVVADTENNNELLNYFGPGVARKFTKYYNHTKMILIDDEILILGSMNLSDNSLDKNREIWIILIDKEIISQFKKLFDKDWQNSKYKL